MTVLPIAALAGAAIPGEDRPKALGGAFLIAGGAAALAFLPGATIAWTVMPQILAGAGMGLALPAFSDERDTVEAARNLIARHAGIVIVLAILAPVATFAAPRRDRQGDPAGDVARARRAARPRGASSSSRRRCSAGVDVDNPRTGLQRARSRPTALAYSDNPGGL